MNEIFRVVFDTNILFSVIGRLGNPHQCVQAVRQGKCWSITCEPIRAELPEKLQLKRGFDVTSRAETTGEIRAFSKVGAIPGNLRVIAANPDDDAVVECAVVGQAQFIVSGDRHGLARGRPEGIQIVWATEFRARIRHTSSI